MELLLTGMTLTARDAAALHLVNRVTSNGDLLNEARALAVRIADNAPRAVAESRNLAASTFDEPDSILCERGLQTIGALMSGDDAKEGVRAFLEKRPPVWKGR
jgi:enoyl-CoA hydratase/carnithine racemase